MNPDRVDELGTPAARVGWGRILAGAGAIAALQAAALSVVILIWLRTKGTWGHGAYGTYFVSLCFATPIVAWSLAARRVGLANHRWWHAWPIGVANFLVLISGEGLSEAGAPSWAPIVAVCVLTFLSGATVLARSGRAS